MASSPYAVACERLTDLERRELLMHAGADDHELGRKADQGRQVHARELGEALRPPLRQKLARGHDAALAHEALPDADLLPGVAADQIAGGAGFQGEPHDGGTIAPVRELVIVITDLYPAAGAVAVQRSAAPALPGLAHATRFGERSQVTRGWRDWLVRRLDRAELAAVAPANIAAAAAAAAGGDVRSQWIATPVYLQAGISQVHLDHRGVLRLRAAALARLAAGFARTFAGAGLELVPLPSGEFLLRAAAIPAVETREPERCAGAEIGASLPRGAAAAALRRTAAEIEMWLHAQSSAAEVNALWLWGAQGAGLGPDAVRTGANPWRAFGADAYLDGLMALQGARCEPLPPGLGSLLQANAAADVVLALRVAEELQSEMPVSFTEGLARLDERFIAPAVAALRSGSLARLTLIANDRALTLGRRSALRVWRRARAPLEALQ
jgi:hypothetical protein